MRPTETRGDTVFAHAEPHSGHCAVLPPDDDLSCRAHLRYFTISLVTSPVPTASVDLQTSTYPPLRQHRSTKRSTLQRTKESRSYGPHQLNGCQSAWIASDDMAHGCATVARAPLPAAGPHSGIGIITRSAPFSLIRRN